MKRPSGNPALEFSRLTLERRLSINQGLNMSLVERRRDEIAIGLQGQIEIIAGAGFNPNMLNVPDESQLLKSMESPTPQLGRF
jgi:hypothetical protein